MVEDVMSTVIETVSRKSLLALSGLTKTVRTDNGTPFNGENYQKLLDELSIKHRKVTPLWLKADGQVCISMRNL